jgi:hypothetical protein
MFIKPKQIWIVGNTKNKKWKRVKFQSHAAASKFIGQIVEKRDPDGVEKGLYFIDGHCFAS